MISAHGTHGKEEGDQREEGGGTRFGFGGRGEAGAGLSLLGQLPVFSLAGGHEGGHPVALLREPDPHSILEDPIPLGTHLLDHSTVELSRGEGREGGRRMVEKVKGEHATARNHMDATQSPVHSLCRVLTVAREHILHLSWPPSPMHCSGYDYFICGLVGAVVIEERDADEG